MIRGNRDLIKEMNRNLLLNIIRQEVQLSRKQLTDFSGLSVGSVSGIVAELLDNQWVIETGEGDFTGGRRQTMLRLNPNAGYAMGLKLMEDRVVLAISNFESKILQYWEKSISHNPSAEQIIPELTHLIQSVLHDSRIAPDKLFGIGIGLAGVIHSREGIVHYSPYFGWQSFALAHLLEQELQYPVYIENDVNTLTLTEQLFGAGNYYTNFVVITIGRGIGLGIVINNQLYHGMRGGAGEFGHTVMHYGTSTAETISYQTLENVAADPALIRQMNESFSKGRAKIKKLSELVELADAGNETALKLLAKSGGHIGASLANIINLFNPELVVISGEGTIAGDYRLKPLMETLKQYTFNGLLDNVEIVVEPTDDHAWARGAASLVISKVFESPITEAKVRL